MNQLGASKREGFLLDTTVGKGLLIVGGMVSSAVTGWGVMAVMEYLTKMSFQ